MARKRCPVCLRDFEGRRDRQTCSPRCKKRLSRTKPKDQILKDEFSEGQCAIRTISAYLDDYNHKARAHNMLRAIIREAAGYLPDYERWALAGEFRESVDVGAIGTPARPGSSAKEGLV